MTTLEVAGLRKRFGSRRRGWRTVEPVDAVADVSFTIQPGTTYSLVGESGAGKSTVGRLVTRLIPADGGRVQLEGRDVLTARRDEMRAIRREIQMIFQDPHASFDPRCSIGDAILEPLEYYKIGDASGRRDVRDHLAERVGLGPHLLTKYPGQLSGGELQRAAIARVLTLEPQVIVCDEVVSALDVSVRALVVNLLKDLQEERGLSYLFIAHDLALVEAISDEVAVMLRGRVVEQADAERLFSQPEHDYTRLLLSAIPRGRAPQADTARAPAREEYPARAV